MVVAVPAALVIERDNKEVSSLQGFQQHVAFLLVRDGIAQRATQAVENGGLEQEAPDTFGLTLQDLFAGRYRGKRYSFGYPACPDLEMQRELFATLKPEEIGVLLTEGDMMDPEASVSALVFHHPEARYFGV